MLQADGQAYFQPQFATMLAKILLKLLDAAMTELGASFGAGSILHR
jgi:hypothetical protein